MSFAEAVSALPPEQALFLIVAWSNSGSKEPRLTHTGP